MINFYEKKSKTRIPAHDYVLDKEAQLGPLLDLLTPKFNDVWTIALVDPSISFVNEFLDRYTDTKEVTLNIYMPQNKLDVVVLKHTRLVPKKMTTYETFLSILGSMTNTMSHDASKYLYKACNGDIEVMEQTITKLDKECSTGQIDISAVKEVCTVTRKPLYSSAVYEAFLTKQRTRWQLLDKLEHDLGKRYAYYSLRKQSQKWLTDKTTYLNNEDVKNFRVKEVDSAFIVYAYLCFMNSSGPDDLFAVMYDIDHRSKEALERRLNVNLQ